MALVYSIHTPPHLCLGHHLLPQQPPAWGSEGPFQRMAPAPTLTPILSLMKPFSALSSLV